MSWQSIYQSRVTTPDEAVKAIQSGNRLFLTGNVSVPKTVLAALVRRDLQPGETLHPIWHKHRR